LEKIRAVSSTDPAVRRGGKPFDCVLMDLEMPVMDGLTAVKHIRVEEAYGKLSLNLVIALSECRRLAFLAKHFSLHALGCSVADADAVMCTCGSLKYRQR
jgi:CheY-like chemotaxis protein